jgi:hypothetical protein
MSANTFTFSPILGDTATLAVTQTTGSVAMVVPAAVPLGALNVRIYNAGANVAFIQMGSSSVVATTAKMPIPPGAVEVFSLAGNTHIAAICAGGLTTTLYFTAGHGA